MESKKSDLEGKGDLSKRAWSWRNKKSDLEKKFKDSESAIGRSKQLDQIGDISESPDGNRWNHELDLSVVNSTRRRRIQHCQQPD